MKQYFFSIWCWVVPFILPVQVYSAITDSLQFKQITYENGLPGNNLKSQVQDRLGFMWISVEAMGVCKYDGQKFTSFVNDPNDPNSLSSNFVNQIIEDPEGELWFATDKGLSRFDQERIRFDQYHHMDGDTGSLPNDICNTLFIDSQNRMWVGTRNGLSVFQPEKRSFQNYLISDQHENLSDQLNINAIQEFPKGIFWIGTDNGLIQFSEEKGVIQKWVSTGNSDDELIYNVINTLLIDLNQMLWIGTHRGLDRFDLKQKRFVHFSFHPADRSTYESEGVNAFLLDRSNMLWVSTYTQGIIYIDLQQENYQIITGQRERSNSLKSNNVKYVINDRNENIWIGTKFEGLFKLEKKINLFNRWPSRLELLKELRSIYIFSVLEENESTIWVGSKLEGLYRIDLNVRSITHFSHDPNKHESLSANRIQSILCDSEKRLWVGTFQGLDFFERETNHFIHCDNRSVNVLFEDHNRCIWVGTNSGLFRMNAEKFHLETFPGDEILFNNRSLDIYSIIEDRAQNLWVSTRTSGLFVVDASREQVVHFTESDSVKQSINTNMVRALFEDSRGNVWIGTRSGGLNYFNPETKEFNFYGTEDGLPSELILGIREDRKGNLWIGTHNGISKFNPADTTFTNYNSDAGLTSNIIEPGAVCFFSQGEMLFGGDLGFNVFYPEDIKQVEEKPRVIITSVSVFNTPIAQDIDTPKKIELAHTDNYITFEFIHLDFKNPYRHQYAYKLEGFDPDWNNSGNRNYISYNGLAPGKYKFYVKAVNEFGNWSVDNPSVEIIIRPPFYKTLLFRILLILTSLLLIASVFFSNSQRIKRRQRELEQLVQERTASLKEVVRELSEKNELISEQKHEIEQNQALLEEKVQSRTRELEIAKQRAEETDRLKSSFLANMSHEIRTPLNAICGFSSLLDDDDLDKSTRKEYIDLVSSNSAMLLKLIEDILDLSKIEAKQLTIHKEKFPIQQLITDLFAIFSEEMKTQNITEVELRCPKRHETDQPVYLFSDEYRIKQVMLNLLNNALKFCRKGYIEFGYLNQGDSIFFYVKDTGIGIPPSHQEMIFNRFIKIEDKKVMYRGTGLGLSISQSIVELLGGRIWVESVEGKGSTFSFKIPLTTKES
ncbi:MAG TPA: two-component regulator propeller domain-containing protein [Prolixibacteraceae bacterium]|nr:two-component regulator propeller domain-containing protein [Prolixibacteraceae bacterium]